jgi:rhodanese-related sulfurtransferase
MRKRYMLCLVVLSAMFLLSPLGAMAAQMEGKILYITNKFKTFQLQSNSGKVEIFKFGKDTGFLKPNDIVQVTFSKAKNAKGVVKASAVKKLYKDGGVSPAQFKKLQSSGAVIIDVRNNKDAGKGLMPGAKHIPLDKLETSLGSLSKGKKTVIFCNSGPIAAIGYTILKNNGFKDVQYLAARVRFKKGKLSSIK